MLRIILRSFTINYQAVLFVNVNDPAHTHVRLDKYIHVFDTRTRPSARIIFNRVKINIGRVCVCVLLRRDVIAVVISSVRE